MGTFRAGLGADGETTTRVDAAFDSYRYVLAHLCGSDGKPRTVHSLDCEPAPVVGTLGGFPRDFGCHDDKLGTASVTGLHLPMRQRLASPWFGRDLDEVLELSHRVR